MRPIRDEIEKRVRGLLAELLSDGSRNQDETEKNLNRTLDDAESSDVELTFDEGDDLFGR